MPHKDLDKKKEYHRNYYIKQRNTILGGQLTRWRAAQLFIYDEKMKPCKDCGFMPIVPDQMDFDHVSGEKIAPVAKLVSGGKTIEKIKEELSKCDLVCANCHRLRTYKRRKDA